MGDFVVRRVEWQEEMVMGRVRKEMIYRGENMYVFSGYILVFQTFIE
jgi:hypothetical protein